MQNIAATSLAFDQASVHAVTGLQNIRLHNERSTFMEATKTSYESLSISVPALASLVSELIGGTIGYPDPENPTPPGPWDPYIRKGLIRLGLIFGPTPEPWQPVFGPGPQPWNRVALNPQPLPPKAVFAAFIAQEVIDRAMLLQEIADAISRSGESQAFVSGMVSRFIDDCGNDRLWRKRPFPQPKDELDNKLTALELVVMGAQFEQSASAASSEQLQQEFRNAGVSLTRMATARMS